MKSPNRSKEPEPFRNVLQLDQQGIYIEEHADNPYDRQLQRMEQEQNLRRNESPKKPRPIVKQTKYSPLNKTSPASSSPETDLFLKRYFGITPEAMKEEVEAQQQPKPQPMFTDNVKKYVKRQPKLIVNKHEEKQDSVPQVGQKASQSSVAKEQQPPHQLQKNEHNRSKSNVVEDSKPIEAKNSSRDDLTLKKSATLIRQTRNSATIIPNVSGLPDIPPFKGFREKQLEPEEKHEEELFSIRFLSARQTNKDYEKMFLDEHEKEKDAVIKEIPGFADKVIKPLQEEEQVVRTSERIMTVRGVKNEQPLFNSRFQNMQLDAIIEEDESTEENGERSEGNTQLVQYADFAPPGGAPKMKSRFRMAEMNNSFEEDQEQIIHANQGVVQRATRFQKQQIGFNEDEVSSEGCEKCGPRVSANNNIHGVLGVDELLENETVELENVHAGLEQPHEYKRFVGDPAKQSFMQDQTQIIEEGQKIVEQESRFQKKQQNIYDDFNLQRDEAESDGECNGGSMEDDPVTTRSKVRVPNESYMQDQAKIISSARIIKDNEQQIKNVQTGSYDLSRRTQLTNSHSDDNNDNIEFKAQSRNVNEPVNQSRFQEQKTFDELSESSLAERQQNAGLFGEKGVAWEASKVKGDTERNLQEPLSINYYCEADPKDQQGAQEGIRETSPRERLEEPQESFMINQRDIIDVEMESIRKSGIDKGISNIKNNVYEGSGNYQEKLSKESDSVEFANIQQRSRFEKCAANKEGEFSCGSDD